MTLRFDPMPSPAHPNGTWRVHSDVLDADAEGDSASEALTALIESIERREEW